MAFRDIKFNVAPSFPKPDYPGILAVFAPKVRCRVGASDTVQIRGHSREDATAGCFNHPSIRGRVITIVHDKNEVRQSQIPSHPDINLESSDGPFVQLQFIMTKSECEEIAPQSHWQVVSTEILSETQGLMEVAHTNLLIWVEAWQVESLVAIFHVDDCMNQTFGPVSGQVGSCFTCSNCTFSSDGEVPEIKYICSDLYEMFGPGTREINPQTVSETEREVEGKFALHKMATKLTVKSGKIGSTSTLSCHMAKSAFQSISNKLGNIDSTLVSAGSHVGMPQPILRHNLSLETRILQSSVTTITARTQPHLSAINTVFSNMFGVGVRKRPPSKKDIELGRSVSTLQQADTVHLVKVDLSGFDDEIIRTTHDWFPHDAVEQARYFEANRNYIKFRYNHRTREFRLTIKAMAIKVGECDAAPVMNFLRERRITFPVVIPGTNQHRLRVRRVVEYHGAMYVISKVLPDCVILVRRRDPSTSIQVSINDALNGLRR